MKIKTLLPEGKSRKKIDSFFMGDPISLPNHSQGQGTIKIKPAINYGKMPELEDKLEKDIQDIVEGLGYSLVELSIKTVKQVLHVIVVVYSKEGIGTENCAQLYRLIYPNVKVNSGKEDIHLEISSPGITRNIKNRREYSIFQGKGIKLLLTDSSEWIGGILQSSDKSSITLWRDNEANRIAMDDIRKAKLDYTEEVQ